MILKQSRVINGTAKDDEDEGSLPQGESILVNDPGENRMISGSPPGMPQPTTFPSEIKSRTQCSPVNREDKTKRDAAIIILLYGAQQQGNPSYSGDCFGFCWPLVIQEISEESHVRNCRLYRPA